MKVIIVVETEGKEVYAYNEQGLIEYGETMDTITVKEIVNDFLT